MIIVLDAGHGRFTFGKRVPDDSMREWVFNSAVAKKVAASLSFYKDVQVVFTHDTTGEKDVPLRERTNHANKIKANVLVSIHANAAGSGWSEAHGVETFVQEGRASGKSRELAKAVQSHLVKETGLSDRGVKEDNLHMLRESDMPAILVECGFMTNKKEAALLKSDAYREKCAKAIVAGLVSVFDLKKKETTKPVKKPIAKPVQKGYTGSSLVDYLKSVNKNTDFISRRKLAEKYGIRHYSGTTAENLLLLDKLRKK